jgi:inosine-uridine nucleoside N-ribohydrolase
MEKTRAIILDTDIGYDPDDLFALLVLAKLAVAQLQLVVTANEKDGKRAQFARMALDELNLSHVPVVVGSSLGLDKFTVDSLLTKTDAIISTDYIGAIKQVVEQFESVTYIGIGGFSNLAHVIKQYPQLAEKMDIYVMGGAVAYKRSPDWVEYNIKIDVPSAKQVIESGLPIKYIMAQTTHNPMYEVTIDHPWYKQLESSTEPGHKLLYEHCKLWFTKRGHGTSMHDPLTVLAALGYSFTAFTTARVTLDDAGVIQLDDNGTEITYSVPESQAQECMDFIGTTLI